MQEHGPREPRQPEADQLPAARSPRRSQARRQALVALTADQAAILRLSSRKHEPQLVPHFRLACSSAMDLEVARKASISLSATSKQLQRMRPRGTGSPGGVSSGSRRWRRSSPTATPRSQRSFSQGSERVSPDSRTARTVPPSSNTDRKSVV